MAEAQTEQDYVEKDGNYYAHERREMLAYVPSDVKRVLDVGCGAGMFGAAIKRRAPCVVEGVEIVRDRADQARSRLDYVWSGDFGPHLSIPTGVYDCVTFNDVLEHLVDPWATLAWTRTLLSPAGVVVASIPNIQHFPTMWKLVWRGDWTYQSAGTLDRTHLRFFTRSSIGTLLLDSGYVVRSVEGINRYMLNAPDEWSLMRRLRVLERLVPGRFEDMGYLQFAVCAAPRPPEGAP